MDWSDTYDIVDSLCEKYPNEEPEKLLFFGKILVVFEKKESKLLFLKKYLVESKIA